MAVHTLDRPIWQALTTHHAPLARKHGSARGYDPAYASFIATADDRPESLADLDGLLRETGGGVLFTTDPLMLPGTLACVHRARVEQMTLSSLPTGDAVPPCDVRTLTTDDAASARTLVELTKPGPFGPRTLELGRYVSAFEGGALVGLAGERMSLPGHVEISAVCTHPEHRGRGLARALVTALARDALDRGTAPFLHVFADNTGAIAAYRKMGFVLRRTMHLAVVKAAQSEAG